MRTILTLYVLPAIRAMRHLSPLMTAALFTALHLSAAAAQSPQRPSKEVVAARVDSMVRAFMAEKGSPSISVAISRGSEVLLERAWGVADIVTKRPVTAASVYRIGSISKQFTAVLILKQVERGKLALTDSIGHYLTTGLRPEWRPLTIEQLLNHTAGLPGDLQREGRPEEEASVETMIGWAARDTMLFAPGTQHSYSNVGYLLLEALVEKLYGKPQRSVVREEIALPLGLRTLDWCTAPGTDPLITQGHQYLGPGQLKPSEFAHPSKSVGGALCASAADLAAWNRALHGGRVLAPTMYTAMITPRAPATGYGFGLQMTNTPWGGRVLYHLGGIMGFFAQNAWFPAESLSVTMLYNNSSGNGFPNNFALEIARAVSSPAVAADTPAVGIVGEEARRQFAGEYQLGSRVFKVDGVAGKLVLTTPDGIESPLVHQLGATYAVPGVGAGTTITFIAGAEGRVVGFLVRYEGGAPQRLQRIR